MPTPRPAADDAAPTDDGGATPAADPDAAPPEDRASDEAVAPPRVAVPTQGGPPTDPAAEAPTGGAAETPTGAAETPAERPADSAEETTEPAEQPDAPGEPEPASVPPLIPLFEPEDAERPDAVAEDTEPAEDAEPAEDTELAEDTEPDHAEPDHAAAAHDAGPSEDSALSGEDVAPLGDAEPAEAAPWDAAVSAGDAPFPGAAHSLPDGSAPSPEYRVKANLAVKRYYTDQSAYFARTEAQVWFRTAEDAERAGFTSSG